MDIRNILIENETWFVAKDICNILELTNITETLRNIPENMKKFAKISTKGGKQNMIILQINDIKKLLQNCRSINKDKIISSLNINLDIIYECKEASYLKIISSSFKYFSQIFQYKIGIYRIDLYFPKYKLAIEVDENNHKDRCEIYENKRKRYLEKQLGCKFIRFNPDEEKFNIGNIISDIMKETILINADIKSDIVIQKNI